MARLAWPLPRDTELQEFVKTAYTEMSHEGKVVETVKVEAQGAGLIHWCDKFCWPRVWFINSSSCGGVDRTVMFAEEFARRGWAMFEIWFQAGSPSNFTYVDDDFLAYKESQAFSEFMEYAYNKTHRELRLAYAVGDQIRGMFESVLDRDHL